VLLAAGFSHATWKPEFGVSPQSWIDWFASAQTTDAAYARLGWRNCCDHSDRFKTRFRSERDGEAWFYEQDGAWKRIPDDVIHREPDPSMPAQLKNEGVLFIYPPVSGQPTCFWPPEGGV
jgi:hypothetical protein